MMENQDSGARQPVKCWKLHQYINVSVNTYLTYAANYNTKADICKLKGTTRLHKTL